MADRITGKNPNDSKIVACSDFPCGDVYTSGYRVPEMEIKPDRFEIVMVSEAPPQDQREYFYHENSRDYLQPTIQIFNDAGVIIKDIRNLFEHGIYVTTAIKCPKQEQSIALDTIKNCSVLLERELGLFPHIKALVLNGDVAIRAFNEISRRNSGKRVIPAGSTYKIRKERYFYQDIRVLPSYILTGKNLLIERSKRRMITEDIREALNHIRSRAKK